MGDLYNNMDKHISEKMQSKEFEVGPNQWANMNELLDKQAAAAAGSSAWQMTAWIAGGSIAAALTAWILWQGFQQSPSPVNAGPVATATEQVETPQQKQELREETKRLGESLLPVTENTTEQKEVIESTTEQEEAEASSSATAGEQPMANNRPKEERPNTSNTFGIDAKQPTPPVGTQNQGEHQSNEGRYLSSHLHPFTETAPEGPQPKPESREVTPAKKPELVKPILANSELPRVTADRLERTRLHTVPLDYQHCAWGYGFKGGVSTTYRPTGTNVSPMAGAFLTYSAGAKVSFQVEANYRRLAYPGATNSTEIQQMGVDLQSPMALQMIELPLLVRYKVLPLHHLNAGVRTSLVAHAQTTNPDGTTFKEMGGQPIDLSVLLGYEFSLSEQLSIELRYNLGLVNLQAKAAEQREAFYAESTYANEASGLMALESEEQLIIPTMDAADGLEGIRVNRKLRNSDLQLSMYYRF